jgi:tellurite methyltransferase
MGGPSLEIYEVVPALKQGGKVLDLGCGEGRNSLFLAQQGFDVTCIDRSENAIRKVRLAAQRLGVPINAIVSDIAHLEIESDYDLIMAHGVLYYLSNLEWRELLAQAKERTLPGGLNIYSVFIFTDEHPRPHEFKSARYTHSLSPRELEEFYDGWEIIRYDQYVKWDQHPELPVHAHPVERIVAREPRGPLGSGDGYEVDVLENPDPVITAEQFDRVPIGGTEEDVLAICGEPRAVHEVEFGGQQVGATRHIDAGYQLRDLLYGDRGIQLINGQVRGKYLYQSPPVRVRFSSHGPS